VTAGPQAASARLTAASTAIGTNRFVFINWTSPLGMIRFFYILVAVRNNPLFARRLLSHSANFRTPNRQSRFD
jgi:hypothetical protein